MKPIIAANWKMNLTCNQASDLILTINSSIDKSSNVSTIICPPACYLTQIIEQATNQCALGAQNISMFERGAYTGDISAEMVQSCGAKYVILGHSERRHVFLESNQMILSKLKICEDNNLIPILCVGETLDDRSANKTMDVILDQLQVLDGYSHQYLIAYEPVWAIGTGKTATPDIAQEVHAFIRKHIKDDDPILYGGSVKSSNVKELLSCPDINGALIGGASLDATEFEKILEIAQQS